MMRRIEALAIAAALLTTVALPARYRTPENPQHVVPLRLFWTNDMLNIRGPQVPGGELKVRYLEAYCRAGSTNRDWRETVIGHKTDLVEASADGCLLKLRCTLKDGVVVNHTVRAGIDEVDLNLIATNPTQVASEAQWAQPCVRVASFTGIKEEKDSEAYLPQSFIFVEGRLARMPTHPWAKEARYTPGQVWCPKNVNRNDVNPRPLSPLVPSNGLIGCFSADEKTILATAWEPYQELFQGIIVCLHSDFRIGGLQPGESKRIRGKIYIVKSDISALLKRYQKDFPEHLRIGTPLSTAPRRQ